MSGYKKLSASQIKELREKLIEPNECYPHYQSILVDESKEEFRSVIINRFDGQKEILVSNYGRIKYKGKLVEPYIVGTFLHCTKVYSKEFGDHYVYNLVKQAFDPIANRYQYQIHHINNNALDNRPENLIYVTEEEHREIDNEFNKKLIQISKKIYKRNYNDIITYFNENLKRTIKGSEIIEHCEYVFREVVIKNTNFLCEQGVILCIERNDNFNSCKFFKLL